MGAVRHGRRCRHTILIERLDAVSRTRALTLQESLALEHAIKREQEAARRRRHVARLSRWSPDEHERAKALRSEGLSYGKIAEQVGRSPDAVACRLRDYGGVSAI